MLFSIQMNVQKTDFSAPEAAATVGELERVLNYYDAHASHEDQYFLSNILKLEPQLAKAFEDEHIIDHRLSNDLRRQINIWKNSASLKEQETAGREIFYALNAFIAFNLYHMNKEENELLLVLWKHFTDEEIMGMEQQLLATVPQQDLIEESRWMMRSLNTREITEWLGGIKHAAPVPVYESYVQMASEELSADRFSTLNLS